MQRLLVAALVVLFACAPTHTQPTKPAPLLPATDGAALAKLTAPAEPTVASAPDGVSLKITFVDVDEGDAILIQAGEFDALVDTGSNGHWEGQLEDALATVTGPLDILFLTHPHEDHYGQVDEVLDLLAVSRVITNGEKRGPPRDKKPLEFYEDFKKALAAEGLDEEPAALEEVYSPLPGLNFLVLATGGRVKDTSKGSDVNNDSLVLMLYYAGRMVLLAGDIEEDAGDWLLAQDCQKCGHLKADVLKVPHHGSAHFSKKFFETVRPSYAVISAGYEEKKHCFPRVESYRALRELGAEVYSTSAEGTGNVTLTISPDGSMSWDVPDKPVFVWGGMKDRKCLNVPQS